MQIKRSKIFWGILAFLLVVNIICIDASDVVKPREGILQIKDYFEINEGADSLILNRELNFFNPLNETTYLFEGLSFNEDVVKYSAYSRTKKSQFLTIPIGDYTDDEISKINFTKGWASIINLASTNEESLEQELSFRFKESSKLKRILWPYGDDKIEVEMINFVSPYRDMLEKASIDPENAKIGPIGVLDYGGAGTGINIYGNLLKIKEAYLIVGTPEILNDSYKKDLLVISNQEKVSFKRVSFAQDENFVVGKLKLMIILGKPLSFIVLSVLFLLIYIVVTLSRLLKGDKFRDIIIFTMPFLIAWISIILIWSSVNLALILNGVIYYAISLLTTITIYKKFQNDNNKA